MKHLILTAALLAATATAALADGTTEPTPEPPKEKIELERGKASAVASADLCNVPTSTPPAGYAADAKTWPCKNYSK